LDQDVEIQTTGGWRLEQIFNPQGERLGYYSVNNGLWLLGYVPWNGRELAKYAWTGELDFHHPDLLGSAWLSTSPAAAIIQDTHFYPWGQPWLNAELDYDAHFAKIHASLQGSNLMDWTMLEAAHRFDAPSLGRWLTPDPIGKGAVELEDPQSWNMYAYAGNNPTTNVDPDGEDYYLLGGEACGTDEVQCDKQGYVLDQKGNRAVVTDQQVLSGEVGIGEGRNGTTQITTSQGTFEGQFFDNTPTSIDVTAAPGSALAAVGTNFGIGMYNTVADTANSLLTNLTFGQYSLNLPNVPGGLSNAAVSGQVLAMVLPALVPGGLEDVKAESILAKYVKGSVEREFPSQFKGLTLREIREKAQQGVPLARKALKLLTDSRFRKW
jgi:RHS repeat-associated protein